MLLGTCKDGVSRPFIEKMLFGYIVYTEQGENHGTMILDGVCHSAIHFGRVILSRMVEPSRSQSFM